MTLCVTKAQSILDLAKCMERGVPGVAEAKDLEEVFAPMRQFMEPRLLDVKLDEAVENRVAVGSSNRLTAFVIPSLRSSPGDTRARLLRWESVCGELIVEKDDQTRATFVAPKDVGTCRISALLLEQEDVEQEDNVKSIILEVVPASTIRDPHEQTFQPANILLEDPLEEE